MWLSTYVYHLDVELVLFWSKTFDDFWCVASRSEKVDNVDFLLFC